MWTRRWKKIIIELRPCKNNLSLGKDKGHFQTCMIWDKLVDILNSEWRRLEMDMLPNWFENCVTEKSVHSEWQHFPHHCINWGAKRNWQRSTNDMCITPFQECIKKCAKKKNYRNTVKAHLHPLKGSEMLQNKLKIKQKEAKFSLFLHFSFGAYIHFGNKLKLILFFSSFCLITK